MKRFLFFLLQALVSVNEDIGPVFAVIEASDKL